MTGKRPSVSDLAREAGLELDDTLITLWDAGFSDISGPGDRLHRGAANRARRALGLATRRELGSAEYWETLLDLQAGELVPLLASLGIPVPFEGGRLRKKAISRLRGEQRNRGIPVEPQVETTNTVNRESPQPFLWNQVGHQRSIVQLSVEHVRAIHQALAEDLVLTWTRLVHQASRTNCSCSQL
jgi:hypothetical protein